MPGPTGPIILKDLLTLPIRVDQFSWKQFRPGIKIHHLYGDPAVGPAAALLWYEPGAKLSRHTHRGYEHIFVLANSQTDENGRHAAGTLIINPPEPSHSIRAENGCVVLAIWEKPVIFDER